TACCNVLPRPPGREPGAAASRPGLRYFRACAGVRTAARPAPRDRPHNRPVRPEPSMPDASPPPVDRTIFYVSDGTGITAETFGHSLMTQFEHLRVRQIRLPFVNSADKAMEAR